MNAARAPEVDSTTRARVLRAAEQLVVAHGYEGTALRAIATRAGVNIGSLVYYFRTKEGLFRTLCEERFSPIIAEQVARLTRCKARLDAGEPVSVEQALRAMIEPSFPKSQAEPDLRSLYARLFTDQSEVMLAIGVELLAEPTALFYDIVRRRLPRLSAAELHWRYVGALGSLVVAQALADRMELVMREPRPEVPGSELVDIVVGVVVRGLAGDAEETN